MSWKAYLPHTEEGEGRVGQTNKNKWKQGGDVNSTGDRLYITLPTCTCTHAIYVIDIYSTNASAAEFILYRLKLYT